MSISFIETLQWRGMLQDMMPGTQDHLAQGVRSAYVGFDPTSDSLHIGNLVPIMLLAHFQRSGHNPVVLIGGATGMIGDPSGKSTERNLLDKEALLHNQAAIQKQLSSFLDFGKEIQNPAIMVNNYDWMQDFSFLEFIRTIGKHITVNYMMAKDSVKNRIAAHSAEGMTFTEFSYQLVQGYDFLNLYDTLQCTIQMGGSDQWGNITTGTELIRRVAAGKGFAITCPLITRSDGSKFGKSEGENVWLDPNRTSPYAFYQYWLNTSDVDAERYIKIFTFLDKTEIDSLITSHREAPHQRLLQKKLASEVTTIVHSPSETQKAIQASNILFGKSTAKDLRQIDAQTFLEIFAGVPQATIAKQAIVEKLDLIAALASQTGFMKSNSAARRAIKDNAIAVNKKKVTENYCITADDIINDRFVLLQKGRKNYYLIRVI